MNEQRVEVAIAILHTADRFLMQLRDNIPGISTRLLGVFCGHLDPGETPEAAVKRELLEELAIRRLLFLRFVVILTRCNSSCFPGSFNCRTGSISVRRRWDLGY
jgi:8-oxo-dGTP pyrophosphatase MutT (NUDIX family)